MIFLLFLILILAAVIMAKIFYKLPDYELAQYEHIHKLFVNISKLLLCKIKIFKLSKEDNEKYVSLDINQEKYRIKSMCISIEILLFIIFIMFLNGDGSKLLTDNTVKKVTNNENSKKKLFYSHDGNLYEISLDIGKEDIDIEKIKNQKMDIRNYILKELLNGNKDLENIKTDINLIRSIDDINAYIYWEFDNNYIGNEGKIRKSVSRDIHTLLRATIDIGGIYKYKEEFNIVILKADNITDLDIVENIENNKENIVLPSSINGQKISWYSQIGKNRIISIIFPILVSIIVFIFHLKNIDNKYEIKRELLKSAYSDLLATIVLYMESGLNITQTFNQICSSYTCNEAIDKEIYKCRKMLECGKGIDETLKILAENCNLKEYRMLSQLISQNIKKGSDSMINLLKAELIRIEKDKIVNIKIFAKKAEMKLMGPLMIMLMVVFLIVASPSVISMNF